MNEKQALRKLMKEKRDALSPAYRKEAALACHRHLLSSSIYKEEKWIYTYISFGSELDTISLIDVMLKQGKHVAVPKIMGKRMEFYEISSLSSCKPGIWGILEPDTGSETEPLKDKAGLMLIPGLAFDRKGNRLGYGGGYYDRYLAEHPGHICCGLAYKEQILDAVPADRHDIRVNHLVY